MSPTSTRFSLLKMLIAIVFTFSALFLLLASAAYNPRSVDNLRRLGYDPFAPVPAPKRGLQRSQTAIRQEGHLIRTNSLPSTTQRAKQAQRAESKHRASMKATRNQALSDYMMHRVPSTKDAVGRLNVAHAKMKQAQYGLNEMASSPFASQGVHPGMLSAEERRELEAFEEQRTALEREKLMAWREKETLKPAAYEKYHKLKDLWNVGFGPWDFKQKHLANTWTFRPTQ